MSEIWTSEVTEILLAMVNSPDRISYSEIARRLTARFDYTFTKNACIGRARRLRVPPRPPQEVRPRIPKAKLKRINPPGIPIEELERDCCKFILDPVESRPPYKYCGKPVISDGVSWCATHCERVFTVRSGGRD